MENQIISWISDAFSKLKFDIIDTRITAKPDKGDGYLGDIAFVTVKGLTSTKETKEFNVVLKYGKSSKSLREKFPIEMAYHREVYVYDKIVPAFRHFEKENGANIIEKILPKCFSTLLYKNQEVLLIQNLKALEYHLHDRFKPLNITHLRITFENYGKWHALSLAYRDQKPKEYTKLLGNLDSVVLKMIETLKDILQSIENNLYDILDIKNERELKRRLQDRLPLGLYDELIKLMKIDEPYSVFLHGDCWNNNLMFKYSDSEKTQPESAAFLDFQISSMAAPVMDLSYHLYSTASEQELKHLKELLNIYYASLSKTLKIFGSDVNILFPFAELIRQWKQYSAFGFIMATLVIPAALTDKDDAVDFQDILDNNSMSQLFVSANKKHGDKLTSRFLDITNHFVNFM